MSVEAVVGRSVGEPEVTGNGLPEPGHPLDRGPLVGDVGRGIVLAWFNCLPKNKTLLR